MWDVAKDCRDFLPGEFKDPLEIVQHMRQYLIDTRCQSRTIGSLAFNVLLDAEFLIERSCIDELIGDSARGKGVACCCPRHPQNAPWAEAKPQVEPPARAVPPVPHDGKMLATGEKDEL